MFALWYWSVVLVVLVARWAAPVAAVVGGAPAAPPEPDAAVIFVQRHGRSARLQGNKDDRLGYYSFYGIRYAFPPVGPRRFQRPVRQYLSGELNVTRQCLPCPQRDPYVPNRIIGNEDCLCLNVFAPKMPGEEKGCPVVFFIHGGNYKSGSTASYGGQHFTQKDTILVTAQYRLGSLGYLSTGQRDASGNFGLFDLHSAMDWIKDYIQFFGGDPARIVVMGQGSGGSAASLFAMSPEGRSATGVAALSGAPLSPGAVRPQPEKHADTIAERTGCPKSPAESLMKCLRQMTTEKIVMADEDVDMNQVVDTMKFLNEISGRSGAGARVEGEYDHRGLPPIVAEKPDESLNRKQKRPPMLTGVTSAETSKAVFGKYNQFLTGQLQLVKDFIKKDLIGGLQGVVSGVEGLLPINAAVQSLLPIALPDYYTAVFNATLQTVDGLSEIVEATSDALFNLPAYQSVRAWSSGGPAYLYSFEHVGNLTKGSHFLPGLALTDDSATNLTSNSKVKGPAHGDELAYLFEPLDAEGRSAGGEVSSTDARVRESFVSLISNFAHGLNAEENDKGTSKKSLFGLLPYSEDSDQFLKISDRITTEKGFRFCQMGLWGGMADRLTGALCKNLIGDLLSGLPLQLPLDNVPLNNLPLNQLPLNNLGGDVLPMNNLLPGVLGRRTTVPPRVIQQTRRTTRRSILGLPIDL
ncbi:acylcarnitine hydrolase [Manduca sexta]|uniref:acylcarnitine hydrolase n=1 Tax=Manduca sexta TaxID=7130 RepID=UPI00188E5088|nr:acylcarnitine hydrolase [Manduca sexta]